MEPWDMKNPDDTKDGRAQGNGEPRKPITYDAPENITAFSNRDEETAAELTPDRTDYRQADSDTDDAHVSGKAMGWIAIALSAISFFWLPIILGAAGIIVGFVARSRHAETLGTIAIVAGAVAIVLRLFIAPFTF